MESMMTRPTIHTGRSCSERGRSIVPALRARPASSADIKPPHTGTISFPIVQMAAMPMAPAPIKRIWSARTCSA